MNNYFRWRSRRTILSPQQLPLLKSWLDTPDSLTARVKACCHECFHLDLLSEGWERPHVDEARRLRMPLQQKAWVRTITLNCGQRPWVLGRTIMPHNSLRGRRSLLRSLGTRPLGTVLFTGRDVVRGEFELRQLPAHDPLLRRWGLLDSQAQAPLWARRSTLAIAGEPILVTEVFLPELEYGAAYRQNLA